jgi:hypothetical protein
MRRKRTTEYPNLEEQGAKESMRRRSICVAEIRHNRWCACGRPRALVRHGRRWHRLGSCRHCLTLPAAASPTATSSAIAGNSQKEADRG